MGFSENIAKYTSYAFTVKDNRVDSTDYQQFFERAQDMGVIVTHKYGEFDSKGKLHYHGIMLIHKGFYRRTLCMDGLHLHLMELFRRECWMKYITKEQDNENMQYIINEDECPTTPDGCSALLRKLKRRLWTRPTMIPVGTECQLPDGYPNA